MLVDSDVLIWWLRGREKAAQALIDAAPFEISAASRIEVLQGCLNKRELLTADRGLVYYGATVLPISEAISNRAERLIEIYTLSHGLQLPDALIAATALEHGLRLLSGNAKHFAPIKGLDFQRYLQ